MLSCIAQQLTRDAGSIDSAVFISIHWFSRLHVSISRSGVGCTPAYSLDANTSPRVEASLPVPQTPLISMPGTLTYSSQVPKEAAQHNVFGMVNSPTFHSIGIHAVNFKLFPLRSLYL